MATQETCKDRVRGELKSRIEDIEKLWRMYHEDPEAYDEDLGNFNEYGLCVDYVAPGTFGDQKRGYLRYQLSCGGPQDEFRFFMDEDLSATRIEYWFLDWFDGAKVILKGKALELMQEIYEDFKGMGIAQHQVLMSRDS